MTLSTSFDSIRIADGSFVNVGHEVENFGQCAVVTGWYPEIGCLQLRTPRRSGMGFEPGSWPGDPAKCKRG